MHTIGRRITAPLFVVLMAASLTFGTAAAFAGAGSDDCDYDPPTYLGACTDEEECDARCANIGGFGADCIITPTGSCCVCAV